MRTVALLLPVSFVLFASACDGDGDGKSDSNPGTTEDYEPSPINEAPEATFTSHREGDTERDGYAFVVEAQVSDDAGVGALDVSITAGGVDVCEDFAVADDGTVSCTITPTAGVLDLVLIAEDAEGQNAEVAIAITVNPTDAPVARIDLPTAENTRYYTDIVVDVAAAISDTETAVADLDVTLSSDLDPDVDFGVEVDEDGNLTAGALLSEGLHTLTLTVVDETGKVGQDSVQFEVGPDNNAPLCSIVGPVDGSATLTGEATSFDADISDEDVSDELISVQWSSDLDGVLSDGIASADGVTDFDIELSDGTHTLTVAATDETGATCSASVTHVVGSAPMVAFDSHVDGDIIDEGAEVTFTASVGDVEDAADTLYVAWTNDSGGLLSEEPADASGVASYTTDALTPGEHTLTVTVTDGDGFVSSASVTVVVNGAPSAPVVSIAPASVTTSSDLVAVIDADAVDPEGDTLTYSYAWYVDGVLSSESTSDTLPASATTRGDNWAVAVTANDGRIDGDSGAASIAIDNEAPVADTVSIAPDPASTTQDLTCTPSGSDADGDALSWSYNWTVDGSISSESSDTLASSAFSKDQSVTCIATPSDGFADGSALASAALVISNSAPVVDAASVTPDPATSASILTCSVGASDDDGDSLTYSYAWQVDGSDAGVSTATLDPAYFSRDSEVACTVTASDGTEDSAAFASAAVTIGNSAPDMDSVEINPSSANVSTDLTCVASGTDYDGDSITYSYSWTVNGADAGTGDTLSAGSFVKGDMVACQAYGSDGIDDGEALESAERIIDNSTPSIDSVAIVPGTARVSDTLVCSASYSDADGDSLSVSYSWTVNGVDAGVYTDTLPSGSFAKGDDITCGIEADDGDASSGVVSSASLEVSNTKPAVASVSISPTAPTVADDLVCGASGSDADGDSVSFTYEWTIDGVTNAETGDTLSNSEYAKGQTITCKVTPNDGEEDGAWAVTGGKTILNSAPAVDSIAISPTAPTAGDDLTCGVTGSDADGDAISYTYSWTRNGSNAGVSTATLSSFTTSRGDIYTCTAIPDDGADTGASATSSSVTVVNDAPVISSVTLSSASPTTHATLTANPVVSDSDGDSYSVSYEWYVDGSVVQSGPSNSLSGALHFDKGDAISVFATANDGTDDSAAVQSNMAVVANTPPGAPVVVVDPESPESSDDLVCLIDSVSSDDDGDPVSYSFTWEVNGSSWTGATSDTTYPGDTISSADTNDNDDWTCIATPNDGTDDGATASADESILPSQVVFAVSDTADLTNQIACTMGADDYMSAASTDDWGFAWEDTSGRTPAVVTIDFTIGMVCTGGYTPNVYLNGVVVDTIAPSFDCACPVSSGGQDFSIVPADLSAYDPTGVNEITFDYGMWEGLSTDASGNFAVITVDY